MTTQKLDALQKILSFRLVFESKAFDALCEVYQRCLKESATALSLFKKLRHRYARLWIRGDEPLVALLHTRWYAFWLTELVRSDKAAIEDFVDQDTKAVRVYSRQRILLQSFPTNLCNLRWRVPSRIRYQTSICINDRIVILHRAKHIEPSELPLSTFGGEDRSCAYGSMDGSRLAIDKS